MKPLEELALELRDKYTKAKPCVVGDDDEATDPHTIWLVVENQSFMLDPYVDDKEGADWSRLMLAKALAQVIINEKQPNEP